MSWTIEYIEEAYKDFLKLDGSQKILVKKALKKVKENPLPQNEGGYGKPLRNELSGFLKIKLKNAGIRIVYQTIIEDNIMKIIIIGFREDSEVYKEAKARIKKRQLQKQ